MTTTNVKYIVVHVGTTMPAEPISANLPLHYIITRAGTPRCLRNISPVSGCIDIGLEGGLDVNGDYVADHTHAQLERLRSVVTRFSALHNDAALIDAETLYSSSRPRFDVVAWYDANENTQRLAA